MLSSSHYILNVCFTSVNLASVQLHSDELIGFDSSKNIKVMNILYRTPPMQIYNKYCLYKSEWWDRYCFHYKLPLWANTSLFTAKCTIKTNNLVTARPPMETLINVSIWLTHKKRLFKKWNNVFHSALVPFTQLSADFYHRKSLWKLQNNVNKAHSFHSLF